MSIQSSGYNQQRNIMKIKLKQLLEKSSNLENAKAAEPEKSGEMPRSYELVWLEEDGTEIVEKKKTFKDKEKFDEFRCELEESPNFLQINKSVEPSKVESVDQPSEEYKEIKENILAKNYKRFFRS